MVFHWSLSDSKFPQVSRTPHSILVDLNNVVVRTVSNRPVISKSSSPCTNPLVTVLRAPITIGIIATFMFHSFFNSLARSRYLSLPFAFFKFYSLNLSARRAKSTILQVLYFLLIIIRSDHLVEIRWSVCISKSQRSLCVFHTNVSWWSFTGVWVTASQLRSPGPFSVFLPILIMP